MKQKEKARFERSVEEFTRAVFGSKSTLQGKTKKEKKEECLESMGKG